MQPPDFQQDYFSLFQFERSFDVDTDELTARYRRLQQRTHPDRYRGAGERERRLAVQYSALVNEAYETLGSPVRRAQYLLRLAGVDASFENTSFNDSAFLMEQMMLREQLAALKQSAAPEQDLDALAERLAGVTTAQLDAFRRHYSAGDYAAATKSVAKLQFLDKLSQDMAHMEGDILDY